MVKSLTDSLVSREEEERHQKNLNENEQLKKQIAETAQQFTECLDKDVPHTCHQSHHITGYCKAPVVYNVVWIMAFAFPIVAAILKKFCKIQRGMVRW
ncbi:hypothetical protein RRG08_001839 [Elysia crispata]|uniref:Uncharacterized protein n=1 Tax=Elysia crispata TaxID=231223 RepID=A0AAE1E7I1_9GAST|nr:hypothetical protein RRG08_001839 [Elysia crispata]